jgi:serine/threonine protein kinase
MIELSYGDPNLTALRGIELSSSVLPGVSYQLEQVLGSGSMAIAFRAIRRAPNGQSFAVVKVVQPDMLMEAAEIAELTIRKESVALGRLNEQVPPTPFVVRLLETSELPVKYRGSQLELPWLAMEYVHGGTLEDRIAENVARTGYAFDCDRAAICVEALASGIAAIHEVGVIHRDIKPSNILCCGNGRGELFKIADFGVARAKGLKQTFVQSAFGTPGYAPPEQILTEDDRIGPATDVFALAATTHSLLTGEDMFSARSIAEILSMIQSNRRRSIRESKHLVLELRDQPGVCSAIDTAIAHATAADVAARPQDARAFATAIGSALRVSSVRGPVSTGRRATTVVGSEPSGTHDWKFHVRHAPGDERAIWSAAWDGAGSCLAATTRGLEFWDGTRWAVAPTGNFPRDAIRLVHYEGAGEWLIGGSSGQLAFYREGRVSSIESPPQDPTPSAISGDFKDLAVISGALSNGEQALWACVGRHWLKPLRLRELASLPALARIDRDRWLVGGRHRSGGGFAAFYRPLDWHVERLSAEDVRAYLAAAASPELGLGVVVGSGGRCIRVDAEGVSRSVVPGEIDLSATAVDDSGRIWAASLGKLWTQSNRDEPFRCVWQDDDWNVPVVSLYAEGRRLLGVAADGGLVEGLAR